MAESDTTNMQWILALLYLIICTITDIRKHYINTLVSLIFGIVGIGLVIVYMKENIIFILIGTIPGILIIILSKITKDAIGMGDGILFIVTGIYIGIVENINLIFISFFICSILSVVLLITRRYEKKDKLPFAPFVMCAAVAVIYIEKIF